MTPTLLLIALPFFGAVLTLLLWSRRDLLKVVALSATGLTVMALALGAAPEAGAGTMIPLMVVSITAFIAILAQALTAPMPMATVAIQIILSLSLGTMLVSAPARTVLLGALLITLAILFVMIPPSRRDEVVWSGLGSAVLGLVGLAIGTGMGASGGGAFTIMACGVLLPLFPIHGAFTAALSKLPGTLPMFLVVALPAVGWAGAQEPMSHVPPAMLAVLAGLAVIGAVLGVLRAAVHMDLPRALASIGLTLTAVLWWHVGVTGTALAEAGGYVTAVTVALSGLLLVGYCVGLRYGSQRLDRVRGLARPMPTLAVLAGLLIMAGAGLPLFGVFSGFVGLMAAAPSTLNFILTLSIWLTVTLWMVKLMQRLLFGEPALTAVGGDLRAAEVVALAGLVLLLGMGGVLSPMQAASQMEAFQLPERPEVSP